MIKQIYAVILIAYRITQGSLPSPLTNYRAIYTLLPGETNVIICNFYGRLDDGSNTPAYKINLQIGQLNSFDSNISQLDQVLFSFDNQSSSNTFVIAIPTYASNSVILKISSNRNYSINIKTSINSFLKLDFNSDCLIYVLSNPVILNVLPSRSFLSIKTCDFNSTFSIVPEFELNPTFNIPIFNHNMVYFIDQSMKIMLKSEHLVSAFKISVFSNQTSNILVNSYYMFEKSGILDPRNGMLFFNGLAFKNETSKNTNFKYSGIFSQNLTELKGFVDCEINSESVVETSGLVANSAQNFTGLNVFPVYLTVVGSDDNQINISYDYVVVLSPFGNNFYSGASLIGLQIMAIIFSVVLVVGCVTNIARIIGIRNKIDESK